MNVLDCNYETYCVLYMYLHYHGFQSYQFSPSKQCHLGGVGVEADLMLAWCVGREGEPAIWAVLTGQDDLKNRDNVITTSQRCIGTHIQYITAKDNPINCYTTNTVCRVIESL